MASLTSEGLLDKRTDAVGYVKASLRRVDGMTHHDLESLVSTGVSVYVAELALRTMPYSLEFDIVMIRCCLISRAIIPLGGLLTLRDNGKSGCAGAERTERVTLLPISMLVAHRDPHDT